ASTACARSARAPLRKISVSGSVKVPGCESRKTLVSVTAYHSFAGEVGASNTSTIRRLTLSRRHQLSPIAPDGRPADFVRPSPRSCAPMRPTPSSVAAPMSSSTILARSILTSRTAGKPECLDEAKHFYYYADVEGFRDRLTSSNRPPN